MLRNTLIFEETAQRHLLGLLLRRWDCHQLLIVILGREQRLPMIATILLFSRAWSRV